MLGTQSAVAVTWIATTRVDIIAPAAQTAGVVNVSLTSTTYGTALLMNGYTINVRPYITTASHPSAPFAGGMQCTLTGVLGNGSDITTVFIGGTPASIQSQTSTQVVVTTPALGTAGNKTVLVRSISFGESVYGTGLVYNPGAIDISLLKVVLLLTFLLFGIWC